MLTNPGMNKEAMKRIAELAWADVPVLHVCGSIDPLLGKHSIVIENIYVELGGRISVMIKEGFGHHPHSLRNPKPIADFIEQSVREVAPAAPAFVGADPIRTTYYSTDNSYREFPEEGTYITCRGALFAPCYSRYEFNLAGVEGSTTVIVPKIAASGMPWVFRAGYDFTDARSIWPCWPKVFILSPVQWDTTLTGRWLSIGMPCINTWLHTDFQPSR